MLKLVTGAVLVLLAFVLALSVRPALAGPADAGARSKTSTSHPRTWVYYPSGRAVGYIVRYSKRYWEGDAGAFISIELTKKGAYMIYENATWLNYAYPRPLGERHRYVAQTGEIFTQSSMTRWNIRRRGRLVAFTRGPDGVPAALAFVTGPKSTLIGA